MGASGSPLSPEADARPQALFLGPALPPPRLGTFASRGHTRGLAHGGRVVNPEEERLAGPGPGAAGQGHGVRTDCPRSGGRAPVSGQSGRTDSTPRPPPDQGSGDGLSASNLTLIPSRQISTLTSLRQEHNAFLCEAQALGEGGELFLDLSSGGLGAAWGREEKPSVSVGLQHPRSAPAPKARAPPDAPTGGAPGRAVGAAWGTYCTAWPCGSPGPGLGHSRWRAGRRSRSPSPPPIPRGCCSSLETRETAPRGPVSPNQKGSENQGCMGPPQTPAATPLRGGGKMAGGGHPQAGARRAGVLGCRAAGGVRGARGTDSWRESPSWGGAGQTQADPGGAATPPLSPVLPGGVWPASKCCSWPHSRGLV